MTDFNSIFPKSAEGVSVDGDAVRKAVVAIVLGLILAFLVMVAFVFAWAWILMLMLGNLGWLVSYGQGLSLSVLCFIVFLFVRQTGRFGK